MKTPPIGRRFPWSNSPDDAVALHDAGGELVATYAHLIVLDASGARVPARMGVRDLKIHHISLGESVALRSCPLAGAGFHPLPASPAGGGVFL